ncbi:MAG: 3'-5' exonuclease [Clostridiales bacterium]|nr:3'-5' exonuclease [Clostridiales bacterium]
MPNLNINSRIYKGRGLIKVLENYTVLDIETTSLDCYRGEILEISAIKVRNQQETEYFSELIKIHNKVGAFTTKLTGITNEMILKEGKELVLVLKNFKDFLGDDIIVGHNVNFDINFIYDSMKKNLGRNLTNDYVDTLRIARKVLPHLKHHKLDDLIKYFNLVERNEHRALNDCILTNQVYIRLGELLEPHRQQSVI